MWFATLRSCVRGLATHAIPTRYSGAGQRRNHAVEHIAGEPTGLDVSGFGLSHGSILATLVARSHAAVIRLPLNDTRAECLSGFWAWVRLMAAREGDDLLQRGRALVGVVPNRRLVGVVEHQAE